MFLHHHHTIVDDLSSPTGRLGLGLLAFSFWAKAVATPSPPRASSRTIDRIQAAVVAAVNTQPAGVSFATLYAGVKHYNVTETQLRAILAAPIAAKNISQQGDRYFPGTPSPRTNWKAWAVVAMVLIMIFALSPAFHH